MFFKASDPRSAGGPPEVLGKQLEGPWKILGVPLGGNLGGPLGVPLTVGQLYPEFAIRGFGIQTLGRIYMQSNPYGTHRVGPLDWGQTAIHCHWGPCFGTNGIGAHWFGPTRPQA